MIGRTLTCESCGKVWQRQAMRGATPRTCPTCKELAAETAAARQRALVARAQERAVKTVTSKTAATIRRGLPSTDAFNAALRRLIDARQGADPLVLRQAYYTIAEVAVALGDRCPVGDGDPFEAAA